MEKEGRAWLSCFCGAVQCAPFAGHRCAPPPADMLRLVAVVGLSDGVGGKVTVLWML